MRGPAQMLMCHFRPRSATAGRTLDNHLTAATERRRPTVDAAPSVSAAGAAALQCYAWLRFVPRGVGVDGDPQTPLSDFFQLHQRFNLLQFAAYEPSSGHPFRVSHQTPTQGGHCMLFG